MGFATRERVLLVPSVPRPIVKGLAEAARTVFEVALLRQGYSATGRVVVVGDLGGQERRRRALRCVDGTEACKQRDDSRRVLCEVDRRRAPDGDGVAVDCQC